MSIILQRIKCDMKYISLFSGIEAATVAWKPLGLEPLVFSEIESFPCAILAYHYPNIPNIGDVKKADWSVYRGKAKIVVGGSPCQSFSVAGDRSGLDGASGLVREYFRVLKEVRPTWFVWENVPGVLSSRGGRDFNFLLKEWNELGYHVAWRILDAQFFGVPQRRRRVFVVGHIRDWKSAAGVLFEREGLRGDTKKGRKTRQDIARCLTAGVGQRYDFETETFVIQGNGVRPSENSGCNGKGWSNGVCYTLTASDRHSEAYTASSFGGYEAGVGTLRASGGDCGGGSETLIAQHVVRRLTPMECERLQGFPDDYTRIPWRRKPKEQCPDAPRYKALGNSMAVPVMRWVGARIKKYESEHCQQE